MISIGNAILIGIYYALIGVVISTYFRQVIKPKNFKEDLGVTNIVLAWPIVVVACAIWYLVGFCQRLSKRNYR